jgi:hypothetical protein
MVPRGFEVLPSCGLPPVEFCLRTNPSQAAKSLPRRKQFRSGAKISIAKAVIGPTHGLGTPCHFSFFGSTLHPLIQRCNLNIETFDFGEVHSGELSGAFWQAYGLIRNCVAQAFDVDSSLRGNNVVLGKMATRHANGVLLARRIDRLSALADEHLSCAK